MKYLFFTIFLCLGILGWSQPNKIHYQGIAYGSTGGPIAFRSIGLKFSILDSLSSGPILYSETHQPTTDGAGQFSIFIGTGTVLSGLFEDIPWGNGNEKFLKVEMDELGGTNFSLMGVTPLVSVPYAITAGSLIDGTILYGTSGKNYRLTVTSSGPVWTCYPPVTIAAAGPDQLSLTGATATLAANAPAAGETGTWTIISGSGATLSNANSPNAMFTKGANTAYSLVWTITGPCGSSQDTVALQFPQYIFNQCGDSISYYGKDYPSIQVGTQCWLGKNLNVGSMTNANNQQSNNGSFEKYCYNNLPENCDTFGGLYQWAEAVNYANGTTDTTLPSPAFSGNVQGICPTGWHLPTKEEWCKMMVYLDPTLSCNFFGSGQNGTDIVGKLKSKTLWNLPNVGATDTVHFSAIPGGMYVKSFNAFTGKGSFAKFWLSYSSVHSGYSHSAWTLDPFYNSSEYFGGNPFSNGTKSDGQSIRCVHDVALTCSNSKANAGADQLTITDTVASLQGNLPKLGEQVGWNVISGNGGSFSNPSDPHATFTRGGVEDSVYFLEYNIVGDCGISRDTVKIQFKFNCGNEIKVPYWDNTTFPATLSNRVYPTVKIGNQCWMSKNLNAGDMINSAAAVDSQRNNGVVEKYCYNNNLGYCDAYGGLYQWAEAVQYKNGATNSTLTTPSLTGFVQGICPTGWHLPMDSEWTNLETTLGGSTVAGGALKSTSTSWTAPNVGATNSSGFSALPAGYRPSNGTFGNINIAAFFWSTLESSASQAKARFLVNSGGNSSWVNTNKTAALSIRCIKD